MNILAGFMSFVSVEGIIIIRNEEYYYGSYGSYGNDGSYGSYGKGDGGAATLLLHG